MPPGTFFFSVRVKTGIHSLQQKWIYKELKVFPLIQEESV